MSRRAGALLVAAVVLCLALLPSTGARAQPGHDDEVPQKVLLVTAPALRWADLAEADGALPNFDRFLSTSTTALLSLRTIGARTGIGEGYVTINSGNRASARRTVAGLAFEPDEVFEGGTAADAFERRTGTAPTGEVLHLGFPSVEQTNDRFLYGADPGSFGEALATAGRVAGVVVNGDAGLAVVPDPPVEASPDDIDEGAEGEETVIVGDDTATDAVADADDEDAPAFGEADFGRAAALAMMDDTGQVPVGHTSDLLTTDPAAPYGVRYDPPAVVSAFADAWSRADVVAVELSDLDRTDRYRREAAAEPADELWADALRDSDELFGALLDEVDLDSTLVLLATPAAPRAAESLGVFAMSHDRTRGGLAQSGTTRRPGYVTLPDIAPTVLDALGLDQPEDMSGTRIASVRDITVDADRYQRFADANERALFRDEATGPISVVFVIAQIAAYALAAVAVTLRRGWTVPVSYLALVVLATPTTAFLAGVLEIRGADLVAYGLGIFGAAAVLAGLAEVGGRLVSRRWPRTRGLVAPLALVLGNWLLLVVDVTTGGRLQIDTVFGYSPLVAGRFAGFGNLAFALIGVGAVVAACGGWAVWRLARGPADGRARLQGRPALVMATFLGVTVVVDGAPPWGSDVGGVLATIPAFAVVLLVARGVRISWRRGVLIGAVTAAVLAVFAGLDLARPEQDRTHLGRLVAGVLEDGGAGLVEVVQRKVQTNINILTSSVWTLTIPFALGLMVFLTRRRTGLLRDLQEDVPGVRPMLAGGLLVAGLGFALNDSGVAVPAMMFAVLLPYLTYVLLRWDRTAS